MTAATVAAPTSTLGFSEHTPRLLLTKAPLAHPSIAGHVTDYADAAQLHHSVMSLFPHNLPGLPNQRRSANGIMYRLDAAHQCFIIQSLIAPAPDPHGLLQTKDITAVLSRVTDGKAIGLSVQYNPVKTDGKKRIPIPPRDIPAHLAKRLPWLTDPIIAIAGHDTLRLNGTPIRTADIDIRGTVNNHAAAATDIIHGIGKAQAYGCGMLLVTTLR